jgi:hypothetical protein
MRQAFAHNAELVMASTEDLGAPGAAVTVALCGHWQHEPPCPVAPHHSRAERDGDSVHLRTLFAVDPAQAAEVRRRIDEALRAGEIRGPDHATTRWELRRSGPADVTAEEREQAERLIRS